MTIRCALESVLCNSVVVLTGRCVSLFPGNVDNVGKLIPWEYLFRHLCVERSRVYFGSQVALRWLVFSWTLGLRCLCRPLPRPVPVKPLQLCFLTQTIEVVQLP